jgi:large subunit ribosomal protein L4
MANINVVNMKGEVVNQIELNDTVFAAEVNGSVLHAVVVNYLANQRQGTQSALTRAEVAGGGRKPWRQKGTGRARQGSTRAPQWTHGGIVFAPKPREYRYSLNKKTKLVAMRSALSSKLADNDLIVVNAIELEEVKTKTVATMLNALGVEKKSLIVTGDVDKNVVLASRNIEGNKTTFVGQLNVYDILNSGKLILTEDAVKKITEVYA